MSSEAQLAGDSLRRQTELSRSYAERHNLDLVEESHDLGISAFRGTNSKEGALFEFLQKIESGQIPRGSYLLIESIDRLSREKTLKAFELFNQIIKSGIQIVTLFDEKVYNEEISTFQIMEIIIKMELAHDESFKKSKRISESWKGRRIHLRQKNVTSVCPSWLSPRLNNSGFDIIIENADIIKQIFQLSAAGYGDYAIEKILNKTETKPIGRSRHWNKSYITKILTNRQVLGEYQCYRLEDGKRIPDGDVITDYYPQIIDNSLFYAVNRSRSVRKTASKGRKGRYLTNLFSGILRCGLCGSGIRYVDKGNSPKGGQYLVCASRIKSLECESRPWRYSRFEAAFLKYSRDTNINDVVLSVSDERRQLNDKIDGLKAEKEYNSQQIAETLTLIQPGKSDITTIVKKRIGEIQKENESIDLRIHQTSEKIKQLGSSEIEDSNALELAINALAAGENSDGQRLLRTSVREKIINIIRSIELLNHRTSSKNYPTTTNDLPNGTAAFRIHYRNGALRVVAVMEPTSELIGAYSIASDEIELKIEMGAGDWSAWTKK